MALSTKDFFTLVRDSVTAIQASSVRVVDFTIGSIVRAIMEATAQVALWLQGMILQLLSTTRASTATGADLDSWVADYGVAPRLPAVSAAGLVAFSRFTPTLQAVVPVGTNVQTGDRSQQYTVVLDASNGNYNAGLGGYVLAPSVASINIPVQAVAPGAAGNAVAGAISTLSTALPGVDTVNNAAGFVNGSDGETDDELRARFIGFVASLSKATLAAVQYAATSVQSGVVAAVVENQLPDGTPKLGFFYVVADDGSGAPSPTFLATVGSAVDAVRPLTSTFTVIGPTLSVVNVVMVITTATGVNHPAAVALVTAAITSYINTLTLGAGLKYSRLIQVAYDAADGITNVSGLTINGGTADIAGSPAVAVRTGTVSVS